jgi:hypothetical protein
LIIGNPLPGDRIKQKGKTTAGITEKSLTDYLRK